MGSKFCKLTPCCCDPQFKASEVVEVPDSDDAGKEGKSKADYLQAFREITFKQLKNATSDFAVENAVSEHGEKASNVVYKGKLENQKRMAVKRNNRMAWPDARQVLKQHQLVSSTTRLTNLLGFCEDEMLLVPDYLPSETLAEHPFHCAFHDLMGIGHVASLSPGPHLVRLAQERT